MGIFLFILAGCIIGALIFYRSIRKNSRDWRSKAVLSLILGFIIAFTVIGALLFFIFLRYKMGPFE